MSEQDATPQSGETPHHDGPMPPPTPTNGSAQGEEPSGPRLVHNNDADDPSIAVPATGEEEDEDDREFRSLRRDMPGVAGASAAGIITVGVGKIPGRHEFFRTHPAFNPVVNLVINEKGMDKQWCTVAANMETPLLSIGISFALHTLYFTVTETGTTKVIPVRCPDEDGNQNEYDRTKEMGLIDGRNKWVRLYTDLKNGCYKVYPAPKDRFADPIFPDLKPSKINRLAFRDKGNHIDNQQHPLFMKWAGHAASKK
jgi:hypothetical protein